jgi:hypothetical protein
VPAYPARYTQADAGKIHRDVSGRMLLSLRRSDRSLGQASTGCFASGRCADVRLGHSHNEDQRSARAIGARVLYGRAPTAGKCPVLGSQDVASAGSHDHKTSTARSRLLLFNYALRHVVTGWRVETGTCPRRAKRAASRVRIGDGDLSARS